ncbi:uncharacterized membrane protein YkvA (DUF1232 family) [Bradyrhizobium yuanmingense]
MKQTSCRDRLHPHLVISRDRAVLRLPQNGEHLSMAAEHSVGFEPADRLAEDRESVRRRFWRKLKRVAAHLPFAEDLLAAYYCAFDRQTPRHVQASLLGAIAYFVLPFDFVADVMPMLGFADDAAVLATAIRMVAGHITHEHREAARAVLRRGIDEADVEAA